MDTKLHFIYKNELNMESFIHMLDDATECYKFYWLDALLSLFSYGKTELSFDELLDRMIVVFGGRISSASGSEKYTG